MPFPFRLLQEGLQKERRPVVIESDNVANFVCSGLVRTRLGGRKRANANLLRPCFMWQAQRGLHSSWLPGFVWVCFNEIPASMVCMSLTR